MVYYDRWLIQRNLFTKKLEIVKEKIDGNREPKEKYEPGPFCTDAIVFPRNSKKDYRRELIMYKIKEARKNIMKTMELIEELEELL